MENTLPKGWVETQLIDLLQTLESGTRPKGGVQGISEGVPSIGGEHLASDGGFNFKNVKYIPAQFAEKLSRGRIFKNDVLVVKDGATTGKTSFVDKRFPFDLAFVNEHVFICRPSSGINSKILFYFMRSKIGQDRIMSNFAGAAQGGINSKFASNTLLPLPPLPEQERIVAKLDKLFAQHEKIKKALDRIPQLLKAFRQQVLTQAVTGKLTEQWREGKELEVKFELENSSFRAWKFSIPSRWRVAAYGDVADVKSNLVDPNSFSDYFLIAPDNIEVNTGRLINRPLVSEINPKSGKHLFDKGVIIYSKIRPYLNKLIIADFIGLCSADMYPIDKTVYTETKFIFYYMLSNEFLSYSTTAGERSVLPKINQKGLKEIPFPLPPLQEQQEIVRRVESLFAKADAIESRYQTLKAKIDSLPQAILHKAFKGELVPQLPTDGDAKDLLAEIMALKKEVKGRKKNR